MVSKEALKRFDENINKPLEAYLKYELEKGFIMNKDVVKKELALLEEDIALPIKKAYMEMEVALEAMDEEYDNILKMKISKKTCGEARGLRLRISKVRNDGDRWKKKEKAQYLVVGNVIQNLYNHLKKETSDKETKLKDIEEYYEREEEKRINDLKDSRIKILAAFDITDFISDLGTMSEDVWNNYAAGVEATFNKNKKEELELSEANKKRDEQFKTIEKRKVLLMPYAQFNPFIDLYPETTEEEFQEVLKNMIIAKKEFDDNQKKITEENKKLRDEKEASDKKAKDAEDKLKQERINNQKKLDDQKSELTNSRKEFEEETLKGLFGSVPPIKHQIVEPIEEDQVPVKEDPIPEDGPKTDKEILSDVSSSIMKRVDMVFSKEAKDALIMAANTLNIASMML